MHGVIFQQLQGLSNTVMYVGDGINDLAALAAADAGLAVGATDAMVAAALSTSRSSIAGQGVLPVHLSLVNNNNNNTCDPRLGVCGTSLSSPGSLVLSNL